MSKEKMNTLKSILCTNKEKALYLIVNQNVLKSFSSSTALLYSKLIDLESAKKFQVTTNSHHLPLTVSHSFLAKSINVSKSTVIRSLNYLNAIELVKWKADDNEENDKNVYVLNHAKAISIFLKEEEQIPFTEKYFNSHLAKKVK